ncbi:MAG: 30S ribosome-binding factor RbfA [Lentisphaeria bacterium]|nr:30S ribosome-binding factor RbfA [Lentisphaeria bacterium]
MPSVNRLDRVNELYKRVIADMIERGNIVNTMSTLVSITEVKAAEDLRTATVFVSIYGGNNNKANAIIDHLNKFRHEIQHQLAKELQMKYTPVLKFKRDQRMAAGDNVLSIINSEREEDAKKEDDTQNE